MLLYSEHTLHNGFWKWSGANVILYSYFRYRLIHNLRLLLQLQIRQYSSRMDGYYFNYSSFEFVELRFADEGNKLEAFYCGRLQEIRADLWISQVELWSYLRNV